ncbi:MAG: DUF1573 domain-containing protein [Rikenellaceae bacterium]|nr:DUF1573 domain-containing protein [Rikenellaceae bacterium]
MRNKAVSLFVIVFIFIACKPSGPLRLELSTYSYDFGIITTDSIYAGEVTLTNSGDEALKIGPVNTGCGCTKASAEKYRLEPGESCLLRFTYDPKNKGAGEREEYVIINANTDSLFHILQVRAILR